MGCWPRRRTLGGRLVHRTIAVMSRSLASKEQQPRWDVRRSRLAETGSPAPAATGMPKPWFAEYRACQSEVAYLKSYMACRLGRTWSRGTALEFAPHV